MKRLLVLSVLLTFLFLAMPAGGEEDKAGEYSAYAQIRMTDTLDLIETQFGTGTAQGDYLLFGDALCSFFESGRLQAKSLNYEDIREAAAQTQADFALVRDFKQGTHEEELVKALGDGAEVMRMNLSDEEDAGLRKLLAWKNEAGSVLEALLELDDGEWVLFALGEIA